MLASAVAVIAVVSFVTVFVVTSIVVYNNSMYKTTVEKKIQDVVTQVNSANQYGYEYDKKQQQQVDLVEKRFTEMEKKLLQTTDPANKPSTDVKIANGNVTGQLDLTSTGLGTGTLGFNSVLRGASTVPGYNISRGATPSTVNHLVISAPNEANAGINLMSSDNRSRVFVDTSSGQVNVAGNLKTNSLQLGDKWKISGVGDAQGNDGWLRFFDKNGVDFYGGLAAGNIWSKNGASLGGETTMNNATVTGEFKVSGGLSEHNILKAPTQFASGTKKMNFIRGDTEIIGNTSNIGDLNVGRTLNVNNASRFAGPIKIGHTLSNDFVNDMPLSVNVPLGKKGASFGSGNYWSHFPWSDGHVYIRPGDMNKNINIGDVATSEINLGTGTTKTNIKGSLNINSTSNWINMTGQSNDQLLIGSDGTNKGILSRGPRDFNIYTNDTSRLAINKDGKITSKGDIVSYSIGKDTNDNTPFKINTLNATNNAHPGTIMYQGVTLNAGGLGVGRTTKVPDGQVNIRDGLKIRHENTGDFYDKAALSTWTPNSNFIGAAFGGPDNWSYFPNSNGDTYIRPGRILGNINIGDISTNAINIGNENSENQFGLNSKIPSKDGNTYIRPGANGKSVYIGDTMANEVRLGKNDGSGYVVSQAMNTYVKRHIDATDNWNTSGKTLFTGWYGNKVILGNNTTNGVALADRLPQNSVVSGNNFFVNGNSTATNNLCINSTCVTEADLLKLKNIK